MLRNGGNYLVFRRRDLDSVAPPLEIRRAPTDLMLDLGAFSCYREGDAVWFNIAAPADALIVEDESGEVLRAEPSEFKKKTIDGVTYTMYAATLPPAHYRAYLLAGEKKSEAVPFAVVRAPRPTVMKADGSAPARIAVTPVAADGTPLTRASACLYKKDGVSFLKTASYAYSYEGKLYTAYGALREENGVLTIRPAFHVQDAEGNPVFSFEVGKPISLYLSALSEGEELKVDFAGAVACEPYSLCPKEEAAVTYNQRLLNEEEKASGALTLAAEASLYNRFLGLSIIYKNEYGKTTSDPAYFLVL
jgi:hypothetical protein